MKLEGRRAVITGGGRGIGAAVARALCAQAASVVVSARSEAEIEGVAEELRQAGSRAWAVPCDVTDPAQVRALGERARELLGGVDILVNNAGIASSAPLKAIRLDEWNRIFAVNVTGTFLCTRQFVPAMVEAGWGRVVNVASIAGKVGAPYIAAYAASKHAVVGFTRSVAAELALQGVTVNAVCPGYVKTPMTEASIARITAKTGKSEDEAMSYFRDLSPQKRLMEAEEVAFLVAALCDQEAGGINGQTVVLDGGAVQG